MPQNEKDQVMCLLDHVPARAPLRKGQADCRLSARKVPSMPPSVETQASPWGGEALTTPSTSVISKELLRCEQ